MDLNEKPLYALRDLATRLNIASPTSHSKADLIALIEKRKIEIENNETIAPKSKQGRLRLDNTYIEIKRNDDGKIEFYEATEPKVIIKKYPASIKDEKTRQALLQVKDIVQSLYIALDKVLERD